MKKIGVESRTKKSRVSGLIREVLGFGVVLAIGWGGAIVGLNRIEDPYFGFDDNANYFLPHYVFNFRALVETGQLPEINFHQYLATPQWAAGQTGVGYWPVYVAAAVAEGVLGDVGRVIDVLVWSHLVVAGMGIYWLGRKEGVDKVTSWLGALVFTTLPFVVGVSRNWVIVSYFCAYLPWGLGWFLKWLETGEGQVRDRWLVSKLMLVSTGYVQWAVIVSVVEGVLVVVEVAMKRRVEKLGEFVKWQVVLVLIASPLLLPVWQTARDSLWRGGKLRPAEFASRSVEVGEWLATQVGRFSEHTPMPGGSQILWVGPLLVVAGVVTVKLAMWRDKWWWVMVVGGVMSSAVWQWLYWVPVVNRFRWPFKHYPVFLVGLVVLLVVGGGRLRGRWRWGLWLSLVVQIVLQVRLMVVYGGSEATFGGLKAKLPLVNPYAQVITAQGGRVAVGPIEHEAAEELMTLLSGNSASGYGLYQFGGYDQVRLKYLDALTLGSNNMAYFQGGLAQGTVEYLRLWAVKWIVVYDSVENREMMAGLIGVKEVAKVGRGVVYEISEPLGWVRNNQGQVPVVLGTNEVTIEATKAGGSLVEIAMPALPDFVLLVNGKRVVWRESEYGLIEAVIPETATEVSLVYRDSRLRQGLVISGATMLGWWGRGWWRRRRERVIESAHE